MSKSISLNNEQKRVDVARKQGASSTSHPSRRYLWAAIVAAFVIFLALLGYAETVWLHNGLPQDRVSRIALTVFPKNQAAGGDSREWSQALVREATDAALMRSIIASLDLHDPTTGERLSPEALASSLRLGDQCIRQNAVRGVLLSVVVRGTNEARTEEIAREWSKQFRRRSAAAFPDLVVQPVESLGVPYEFCQ